MTNLAKPRLRKQFYQSMTSHLARLMKAFPWLAEPLRLVVGWTQPRFTAGVVGVIYNSQREILLVEHVFHPRNAWGLPGGWLSHGESPTAGLVRELREELGLEVEILCPLVIANGHYSKTHLDIAYLCQARGDIVSLSYELLGYEWRSAESLPALLPFHSQAIEAARLINAMR